MNTIGVRTLLLKEIRRFMRVPGQTVLSPIITTTLYFVVFGYSLGARVSDVGGVPYVQYIVPGLVFLGIANNSFLNSSSSLFIHKMQGTVVDLLVAPLRAGELLLGFVLGAMARGLLVGVCTWGVAIAFTGFHLVSPAMLVALLLLQSWAFAVLGLLAALWAEKFEQINFFPNFVMLPLTFLGGVFYSVASLPSPWREVSSFNPLVYMVDGTRYAMLGVSDYAPWIGLVALLGIAAAGTLFAWALLRRGYKLKS